MNSNTKMFDLFHEFLFKSNVKKNNANLNIYVIEGYLVLVGSCCETEYFNLIRLSKLNYKKKFFDFLLINEKINDNKRLVDIIKKRYLMEEKKIKRLYLHIYDEVLYIIASVKDDYEKNYLKKLGALIQNDYSEIKSIEYCLL